METFIEFVKTPNDWGAVAVFTFFSLFLSLVFTAVISNNFFTVKPKWLLFALFPALIIFSKLFGLNSGFTITALFVFLLLLIALSMILSFIQDIKQRLEKESLLELLSGTAKDLIVVVIVTLSMIFFGPATIVFVIAYMLLTRVFSPNEKDQFISLQATLPTSKIASMAMGLVEVKGQTKMQESLLSPKGKKPCIGYRYIIQREERDDDGDTYYSTVSDRMFCNDFILKDKTGEVQVKADDIDFIWLKKEVFYSGTRRYIQYLLLDQQEILLVGQANSTDNKVFIEKHPVKNIFTLAPYNAVTRWNVNKPFLNRFLTFLVMLFLLIAFILMADISITDGQIQFDLNFNIFSLNNFLK